MTTVERIMKNPSITELFECSENNERAMWRCYENTVNREFEYLHSPDDMTERFTENLIEDIYVDDGTQLSEEYATQIADLFYDEFYEIYSDEKQKYQREIEEE